MEHIHIEADQTITIAGPAKISLVADEAPVIGQAVAPTVNSLTPDTAVAGDATDITMVVDGTGFTELSRITFNGLDEPTTLISPTQVSTVVKPSLFVDPVDCPVTVRNGALNSAPQTFSFTATARAAEHGKRPARKS